MVESLRKPLSANLSFARLCFEQAGATDALETILDQEPLSSTQAIEAARLPLPYLAKLIEIRSELNQSPMAPILRRLAFFPLARTIEESGSYETVRQGTHFMQKLSLTASPTDPVFVALDRWHGRFPVDQQILLLKKILSSSSVADICILGPSTQDLAQIERRFSETPSSKNAEVNSLPEYFQTLRRLEVYSLEGGSNLRILKCATEGSIGVTTAQKIPSSLGEEAVADFVADFEKISSEMGNSEYWNCWFPISKNILDTRLPSKTVGPLAVELLQYISIARLMAPEHVQIRAPIELFGPATAEVALVMGADDLGFSAIDQQASLELGVIKIPDKHRKSLYRKQSQNMAIDSKASIRANRRKLDKRGSTKHMTNVASTIRLCMTASLSTAPYRCLQSDQSSIDYCSISEATEALIRNAAEFALVPLADVIQEGNLATLSFGVFSTKTIHVLGEQFNADILKRYLGAEVETLKQSNIFPHLAFIWAYNPSRVSTKLANAMQQRLGLTSSVINSFARDWAESNRLNRNNADRFLQEELHFSYQQALTLGLEKEIEQATFAGKIPPAQTKHLCSSQTASQAQERIQSVLKQAFCGMRLSVQDGTQLGTFASIADLALAANQKKSLALRANTSSFVVVHRLDLLLRQGDTPDWQTSKTRKSKPYSILTREELTRKVDAIVKSGCRSVVLEAEILPEMGIDYYVEIIEWLSKEHQLRVHALSPDELLALAELSSLSIESSLQFLQRAGLYHLPGSKSELRPKRSASISNEEQVTRRLQVHETAHRLGITTSCSLPFSSNDSWEERVAHLQKLRTLQDQTGGFRAFSAIPQMTFDPTHTSESHSALDYLRIVAVARLFLDNFPNIESNWDSISPSLGQTALLFGANNFSPVLISQLEKDRDNSAYQWTQENIARHISQAGCIPKAEKWSVSDATEAKRSFVS